MKKVDSIDAKIIEMLQADGRQPSVEIARRVGVTEGTVRNRIERLVGEDVIQISAWADPLQIGYQNYAVLMMHVELRHLESAAAKLANMPEVFFLGTCLGAYDIFVTACFRSLDHMHAFMTKRLSRVVGIQRVSTSHVTRVVKRDYSFHVISEDEPPRTVKSVKAGKKRNARAKERPSLKSEKPTAQGS